MLDQIGELLLPGSQTWDVRNVTGVVMSAGYDYSIEFLPVISTFSGEELSADGTHLYCVNDLRTSVVVNQCIDTDLPRCPDLVYIVDSGVERYRVDYTVVDGAVLNIVCHHVVQNEFFGPVFPAMRSHLHFYSGDIVLQDAIARTAIKSAVVDIG